MELLLHLWGMVQHSHTFGGENVTFVDKLDLKREAEIGGVGGRLYLQARVMNLVSANFYFTQRNQDVPFQRQ